MGKLRDINTEGKDIGWVTVKTLSGDWFHRLTNPKMELCFEFSKKFKHNPLIVRPRAIDRQYIISQNNKNMRILLLKSRDAYEVQILVKNPEIFELLYA